MKYEHGGIEITINEHDATFTATVVRFSPRCLQGVRRL